LGFYPQHCGSTHGSDQLDHDEEQRSQEFYVTGDEEAQGDCGIDVATADVADCLEKCKENFKMTLKWSWRDNIV
jgi:hypothetical protein